VIAFRTAQLRRTCWLALFAILALALLPTISHALALARGGEGGWAAICTPAGVQQVAGDTAGAAPASPAGAMAHFGQCPFCSLGADAPLLPPAPSSLAIAPGAAVAVPAPSLSGPRARFAWGGAQPRGPPLHA
jgi:hypothetical protein